MDTSVRESERLQQELEQLTHNVHEKRAETDALKHEWLALRDECTQLRQQRDRYAKYIKCATLRSTARLARLSFCRSDFCAPVYVRAVRTCTSTSTSTDLRDLLYE